jgi:hypothetical protein
LEHGRVVHPPSTYFLFHRLLDLDTPDPVQFCKDVESMLKESMDDLPHEKDVAERYRQLVRAFPSWFRVKGARAC